ncbi:hypothetical protein AU468_09035 [Alkalispirochaeta sphaeroplastigenens]|uniref:Uncharacterized protein n=1 Tax=Alkalispirochaeta sphaeroplastigenens TaxID=1187066 RepID=A0A2S4JNE9_9SPIO|nr:hypothetical protein AU468_09035 [Alkalispirochaeta sphaeroplastigenens]
MICDSPYRLSARGREGFFIIGPEPIFCNRFVNFFIHFAPGGPERRAARANRLAQPEKEE